ncbi:hypothetical protein RRG08_024771 [Elysia crispata]|uniref:Uncharacterized protein n=1 Tax=Elysia crispata TaxID=231223 RepID=A0AAE1CT81_9GAST|nr:hypothetical protein RRG08_024771 [Elysia crispata]
MSTVHYFDHKLGIAINWLLDTRVISYPSYWYAFHSHHCLHLCGKMCLCSHALYVKSTFTSRRAIVTFIIFLVSIILLRIPMFMTKRVIFEFDPMLNTTRVAYKEFDDEGLAETIQDIMNRNILN